LVDIGTDIEDAVDAEVVDQIERPGMECADRCAAAAK
jgi:hypothetical protein